MNGKKFPSPEMQARRRGEQSALLCTGCQDPVPPSSRFCPGCGKPVEAIEIRPTFAAKISAEMGPPRFPSTAEVEPTPVAAETPACPPKPAMKPSSKAATQCACGTQPALDALFCHRCGAPIGEPARGYCVHCTAANGGERTVGPIDGDMIIGTDEACDLVLADDQFISRRHVRLSDSDGYLFVEDLASSNGTFVRIRRPLILEAGDEVIVGQCRLRIEKNDPAKPRG